jgi:hypothetical protein
VADGRRAGRRGHRAARDHRLRPAKDEHARRRLGQTTTTTTRAGLGRRAAAEEPACPWAWSRVRKPFCTASWASSNAPPSGRRLRGSAAWVNVERRAVGRGGTDDQQAQGHVDRQSKASAF